jgi:hypothetical protein
MYRSPGGPAATKSTQPKGNPFADLRGPHPPERRFAAGSSVCTDMPPRVALLTAPPAAGPVAADAIQALCGAADHLATVLRARSEPG